MWKPQVPRPQSVTVFGNGVSDCDKMRSLGWAVLPQDRCPHGGIRTQTCTEDSHVRTQEETGLEEALGEQPCLVWTSGVHLQE